MIAARTSRIRLGTMITPVPRRRPWQLAKETVTLDRLSGGRLILGAGIGSPARGDFGIFHEPVGARVRAAGRLPRTSPRSGMRWPRPGARRPGST